MKKILTFFKQYLFAIKIALLVAGVIIVFEVINLCVLYGYMRTDLYVSLVAVCFLTVGLMLNKNKQIQKAPTAIPVAEAPELLTAREKQVMALIAEGKTNKEIAATQFVEISTIKTHVNNIYTKLGVKNRKEACAKYIEMAKAV